MLPLHQRIERVGVGVALAQGGGEGGVRRTAGWRVDLLPQRVVLWRGPRKPAGERVGGDRKLMIEVTEREGAVREFDAQFASFQDALVAVAEDRHEHFAVQPGIGRIPVDVEVTGVGAGAAVGQHVPPPAVLPPADAHVIGHHVQHQAHPVLAQRGHEVGQVRLGAQFRVQMLEIAHVVAVGAAGPGAEQRRGIDVADAQLAQVRHQLGRLPQGEVAVELQAIGGARDRADVGGCLSHDAALVASSGVSLGPGDVVKTKRRRAAAVQDAGTPLDSGRRGRFWDCARPVAFWLLIVHAQNQIPCTWRSSISERPARDTRLRAITIFRPVCKSGRFVSKMTAHRPSATNAGTVKGTAS